jgi:2,6-dihydroxypseudooxynicotine hydrolase
MSVRGGRLEFLVPHLLRSQVLRPGFVRLSLWLGAARQMPSWAKLQFLNCGVSAPDLDRVLRRISSLESWVDEWEALGREQEAAARKALGVGDAEASRVLFLAASASYNFAQYVVFMDTGRKRKLHDACVGAYAQAAPMFDPPAIPFEVPFRRRMLRGYLRVPPGAQPAPVVVLFNGTNAVKEELHWWSESLLARGLATVVFDGPGLGETFHRLSMVAEPRPVGTAIVNALHARPELDPEAIAFFGQSLGGYLAIRMAAFDSRIRAVAAVSPPYSADVYWNLTLVGMRRELAALYGMPEVEMGREVHRITLEQALPHLRAPLMISGGGHDLITPGEEAWRIFGAAHCDRELVYYPRGGHDCFNMLSDLRPRMTSWLARQLKFHRSRSRRPFAAVEVNGGGPHLAAEAVDLDFAEALTGDAVPRHWSAPESKSIPARWRPAAMAPRASTDIEVVLRTAHSAPI